METSPAASDLHVVTKKKKQNPNIQTNTSPARQNSPGVSPTTQHSDHYHVFKSHVDNVPGD